MCSSWIIPGDSWKHLTSVAVKRFSYSQATLDHIGAIYASWLAILQDRLSIEVERFGNWQIVSFQDHHEGSFAIAACDEPTAATIDPAGRMVFGSAYRAVATGASFFREHVLIPASFALYWRYCLTRPVSIWETFCRDLRLKRFFFVFFPAHFGLPITIPLMLLSLQYLIAFLMGWLNRSLTWLNYTNLHRIVAAYYIEFWESYI